MPKGYAIFTEMIRDQAGLDAYGKKALPTLVQGGAQLIVGDNNPELLEGEWHGTRTR